MAITATDIQQQSFGTARHGYDPQEVDVFLERLAVEVDTMNLALSEARTRIEAADSRVQAAEQKAQQAARQAAANVAPASGITEDQISRAFIAAQRSADALKEEARQEAEKVYRDAETRGRDIVRDALSEKQRILGEVERLRESCEKFRTEYLSLLDHFQADANKKMPYIDNFKPDVSAAALDDAAKALLAENSATAPAPAPAPTAVAAASAVAPPAAVAVQAAPAAVAATPAPAPAQPVTNTYVPSYSADDDDLEIEEID